VDSHVPRVALPRDRPPPSNPNRVPAARSVSPKISRPDPDRRTPATNGIHALGQPDAHDCLSVQRPGVKLGPSKVLSEDVGSLDLSDIGVVVDRGVRAGAQAYLGPRPEGWLLGR